MINHSTTEKSKKSTDTDFSPEDLKALASIKKITKHGHNAEVKEKDGMLIVYDVSKTKTV